jgi:hypothetical protein
MRAQPKEHPNKEFEQKERVTQGSADDSRKFRLGIHCRKRKTDATLQ